MRAVTLDWAAEAAERGLGIAFVRQSLVLSDHRDAGNGRAAPAGLGGGPFSLAWGPFERPVDNTPSGKALTANCR